MKSLITSVLVLVLLLVSVLVSPACAASAKVTTHASANNGTAVASGEAKASDGGIASANSDAKAVNGGIAIADSKADSSNGSTITANSKSDAAEGGIAVATSSSTSSDRKTVISEATAVSSGEGTITGTSTVNGVSSAISNESESAFEYAMNRKIPKNKNTNILYLIIQLYNGRVIRNESIVVSMENMNINTEHMNSVISLPSSDALVPQDAHVDIPRLIDENNSVVITTYNSEPKQKKPWYWFW